MSLTLCMIVKNEAGNLERCLDSVRGLVGEIVAVDTGSTDATPEIARRHGAKVFSFDFTKVDFAAARNYGLGKATGKWILVLDADEVLDGTGWEAMRSLIERDTRAGYFLERHNFSAGSAAAKRDFCVRLFPNRPDYRFRGRVHETVDSSILESGGRLVRTGIRIAHHFAMDKEARRNHGIPRGWTFWRPSITNWKCSTKRQPWPDRL